MNRKVINNFRKVVSAANHYTGFKVNKMTNNEQFFGDLDINAPTADEVEFEVEEVKIRMPFGVISGKFWGPKDVQPIVCLHGWQDNAGTFDRIIPLLPRHLSFLALDFPGHGFSSRLPNGIGYSTVDNLHFLNLLMKEYKWTKISLIGHSMGAIMSFLYASVYPDKINFVIAIDALKPKVFNPKMIVETLAFRTDSFTIADLRNQEKSEPPSYEYEDLVERLYAGTNGSVTKECCPFLLKRNIKKSEKHPEKYFFTRDSRLKNNSGASMSQEISVELAKNLKMPYLYIQAKHTPLRERKVYHEEVLGVMSKSPKFEHCEIDSTHHLHLTHPEMVAPVINEFLGKYLTRGKL